MIDWAIKVTAELADEWMMLLSSPLKHLYVALALRTECEGDSFRTSMLRGGSNSAFAVAVATQEAAKANL